MDRIACIGLDPPYVDAVKAKSSGHVLVYDVPPRMYSHRGKLFAESPSVTGRMLTVDRVIWYSYFPGNPLAAEVRKAIALSDVPSFPDVRRTVQHDDRALSLIQASEVDPGPKLSRGYVTKGTRCLFDALTVLKVGNDHCGDGKLLVEGVVPESNVSGVVEPFIKDAESIRVLLVNGKSWILKYESADWRKNVNAKVTQAASTTYFPLVARGRRIAEGLRLAIVGIDFIGSNEGWNLLEVNAYPGLDDVVEAQEAFKGMLCDFVS